MNSIKLLLKQDYLTVITRGNSKQGIIYKRTVPSQYCIANETIKDILKVLRDKTDISVVYKDCVSGVRYEINTRKSAPPEDKYKGLPASTRYIPDRLITLIAEHDSEHFDNIKKSKIKYLMSEYDSKRMNAETFERKFNQLISKYR